MPDPATHPDSPATAAPDHASLTLILASDRGAWLRAWGDDPAPELRRMASRLADVGATLARCPDGTSPVIVLDLGSAAATAWLQRRPPPTKSPVVIGAHRHPQRRVEALHLGVDGCIHQPMTLIEVVAHALAILKRRQIACGDYAQFGALTWIGSRNRLLLNDRPLLLPPRELVVARALLRHAPRTCPRSELAELLAGSDVKDVHSTTELYISRLRRHLRGAGMTIAAVRRTGYRIALDGL